MKTPHAILIGLTLIAAALFFREPSVAPAKAGIMGGADSISCVMNKREDLHCYILRGNEVERYSAKDVSVVWEWDRKYHLSPPR